MIDRSIYELLNEDHAHVVTFPYALGRDASLSISYKKYLVYFLMNLSVLVALSCGERNDSWII